jgi:hypothetical protein
LWVRVPQGPLFISALTCTNGEDVSEVLTPETPPSHSSLTRRPAIAQFRSLSRSKGLTETACGARRATLGLWHVIGEMGRNRVSKQRGCIGRRDGVAMQHQREAVTSAVDTDFRYARRFTDRVKARCECVGVTAARLGVSRYSIYYLNEFRTEQDG